MNRVIIQTIIDIENVIKRFVPLLIYLIIKIISKFNTLLLILI